MLKAPPLSLLRHPGLSRGSVDLRWDAHTGQVDFALYGHELGLVNLIEPSVHPVESAEHEHAVVGLATVVDAPTGAVEDDDDGRAGIEFGKLFQHCDLALRQLILTGTCRRKRHNTFTQIRLLEDEANVRQRV